MIQPTSIAFALSRAYGGTCIPQRMAPLLWPTCPACNGKVRLTLCRMCLNAGKVPVLA